ncbi:unnamed protein product (macronuclear) [Paramecium tetraurelia]|uniref:VPS10 domain-containing protein n=1 Tax=Paramecium tetraurelia TaxID=5888 RepID=A0CXY7_PARTE|nr:uncharacterized protein GSPATT00011286001 [Paramecium tetraurelia]CAK75654.1 unnamed protein product [Paramecium tetraurelia]|eukprot:XP_001443051.1 hypothetical protein (macronuclear) [Paramecium tetraurelia strain d4-2]
MRHIILMLITQCFAANIDVQISYIDAPLINIHWCSDTVLALTSKGSVYRSDDRGRQWIKMSEIFHRKALIQLENSDERIGIVNNLVASPVDKQLILFTGTDQIAWISLDCGKTITAVNAGKQLREYQFHPLEKDWIIASAWKQCGSDELLAGTPCVSYKELLLSQDTGITWHSIATYVNQFTWGIKNKEMAKYTPKERILASFEPQGKGHQSISSWNMDYNLYYSDDFFQTRTLSVPAGSRFMLTESFLFVAKVTSQATQEVSLYVSGTELGQYKYSVIDADSKLLEHSYSILDTSENQVFMVVNHLKPSSPLGVIYISDSTGTRYSRSLENVSRLENSAEFYRVQGLEGIYLANVYAEDQAKIYTNQVFESMEEGFYAQQNGFKDEDLKKYKQTRITFDKGGQWVPLKPPTVDADGKPINCNKCQLHLHLSQAFYQFAPIYTETNSIGIIVATGSIGKYLSYRQDQVNTYLSRDGGLTWIEIKKGSYIYEISNHGGLIVMAKDQETTNQIVYSWNGGMEWTPFNILDQKAEIQNIITEPQNKGSRFIAYGAIQLESNGIKTEQGLLATIDLDELHQRNCIGQDKAGEIGSDYELWTPSGLVNPECLFGKKVTYMRKRREAACYNPEQLERIMSVTPCQCSQEDYECDLGFVMTNQQCTPINGTLNIDPPAQCDEYYTVSSGYRKIAGDICEGGVEHISMRFTCPNNKNWIFDWLVIGGILFGLYWLYNNQEKVKEFFARTEMREIPQSKQEMLIQQIQQRQPKQQQQQQQQQQYQPIDLEQNEQQDQKFDEDLIERDDDVQIEDETAHELI